MKFKATVPLLGLCCLILLGIPNEAGAWGNTWMGINLGQVVDATHGRSGPFRYNLAIFVDNAGYDSDLYYGYYTEKVSDYMATAGVNLHVFLPLKKKIVFDLSEIPQYTFLARTNSERSWNNAFRGQVHVALDRVYLQLGAGLATMRDRLSPELNARIRHRQDDFFGLGLWQVSREVSLALQYRKSSYRYTELPAGGEGIRTALDRDEDFANFRAYLQQVSRTRYYLDAEYGSYKFKDAASRGRDARSYGAYAGVEFLPPAGDLQTRGLQGRINLGWKAFDMRDPLGKDRSSLVGNSTVSLGVFRATALQGFFVRDFQFSAFSGVTYYFATTYGGGLAHFFTRRVMLSYDLAFLRLHYPDLEEAGPEAPDVYRYITHTASILFRLRRDLQLTLFASLGRRRSDLAGAVSDRNFVGLSLIYGYVSGANPLLVNPISR